MIYHHDKLDKKITQILRLSARLITYTINPSLFHKFLFRFFRFRFRLIFALSSLLIKQCRSSFNICNTYRGTRTEDIQFIVGKQKAEKRLSQTNKKMFVLVFSEKRKLGLGDARRVKGVSSSLKKKKRKKRKEKMYARFTKLPGATSPV